MSGSGEREGPDLLGDVSAALESGEPLALMSMVSSVMSALDPRRADPFGRDPEPQVTLASLVDSFLGVQVPETTALLAVIAEFSDDELQATRIRREVRSRGDRLPEWLARLGETSVERVIDMTTELGDGDNVLIGLRLVTGDRMSAVIYIDHNMGTLVKDAFLMPASIADLEAQMMNLSRHDGPERTDFADLDPATARARITEAIETAAMTVPPLETESWPAVRPIVEWMTGMLPPGGAGYQRKEWGDDELQQITVDFLASPYGKHHDSADHVNLLNFLLQFAVDQSTSDPYRWSAVSVEILLLDWMPNKIIADPEFLTQAPEVLRSYIAYCHAKRGINEALTQQTLGAVDRFEPEFQRAILDSGSGIQGAALEALMAGHLGDLPREFRSALGITDADEKAVGGERALAALDDAPLPDEAFDWTGIADDIRDRVGEVLALTDRCCDELLDQEYRTAVRRLLARAATGDPEVFRRRGRSTTAAAALCWAVGKANRLFPPVGGLTVRALNEHFGVSGSVSSRANTLLRAAGIKPSSSVILGSPDLLTSRRRQEIIGRRDR